MKVNKIEVHLDLNNNTEGYTYISCVGLQFILTNGDRLVLPRITKEKYDAEPNESCLEGIYTLHDKTEVKVSVNQVLKRYDATTYGVKYILDNTLFLSKVDSYNYWLFSSISANGTNTSKDTYTITFDKEIDLAEIKYVPIAYNTFVPKSFVKCFLNDIQVYSNASTPLVYEKYQECWDAHYSATITDPSLVDTWENRCKYHVVKIDEIQSFEDGTYAYPFNAIMYFKQKVNGKDVFYKIGGGDTIIMQGGAIKPQLPPYGNEVGIGKADSPGFGLGIPSKLWPNSRPADNYLDKNNEFYASFFLKIALLDAGLFSYVPKFYIRVGYEKAEQYEKYGVNTIEIVDGSTYKNEQESLKDGFYLPRAFINEGKEIAGFYFSKYISVPSVTKDEANSSGNNEKFFTWIYSSKYGKKLNSKNNKDNTGGHSLTLLKQYKEESISIYWKQNDYNPAISDYLDYKMLLRNPSVFEVACLRMIELYLKQNCKNNSVCKWINNQSLEKSTIKGYRSYETSSVPIDIYDESIKYNNNGFNATSCLLTPLEKTTHNGEINGISDLLFQSAFLGTGILSNPNEGAISENSFYCLKKNKNTLFHMKEIAEEVFKENYEPITIPCTKSGRWGNGNNQVLFKATDANRDLCCVVPFNNDAVSDEGTALFSNAFYRFNLDQDFAKYGNAFYIFGKIFHTQDINIQKGLSIFSTVLGNYATSEPTTESNKQAMKDYTTYLLQAHPGYPSESGDTGGENS